jgi:hypothetical protein
MHSSGTENHILTQLQNQTSLKHTHAPKITGSAKQEYYEAFHDNACRKFPPIQLYKRESELYISEKLVCKHSQRDYLTTICASCARNIVFPRKYNTS